MFDPTVKAAQVESEHGATALLAEGTDPLEISHLLENFAKDNGLEHAYGYQSLDKREFLIEIGTPDFIIDIANPFNPATLELSTNSREPSGPSGQTSKMFLDKLCRQLGLRKGAQVTIEK